MTMRRGALKEFLLALLSSFLLILCFPKFNFEFLAWFALVPLFLVLKYSDPKQAFAYCFCTGLAFLMGVFYWINIIEGFSWVDFIALGFYFGSYFGLFGLFLSRVSHKTKISPVMSAPVLWVSMEYLRSNAGFMGLPWALLGHSQYLNIPVVQIASISGVYGVTYLIVFVNAILAEIVIDPHARLRLGLLGLLVVGLALGYGFQILSTADSSQTINVTVIQSNIAQAIRWKPDWWKRNIEKQILLTKEAAKQTHTSLIVWSESSVPGALNQDVYLLSTLFTLAKDTGVPLLLGSTVRPNFGAREFRRTHWSNSAFLLSPTLGMLGEYRKMRLLPFAEYLPYKDVLPWPSRLVAAAASYVPGGEFTVFDISGTKFGVTICWENIFPDLVRGFVMGGAGFMVNITNEAWFGETSAPYQFLAMSVFRAVENRRAIARSANTGVSGFIDPYGRIVTRVNDVNRKELFVDGYATMAVPLTQEQTFYTRYGDVWAYVNLIAAIVMLALSLRDSTSDVMNSESFKRW
jgi:apolipoprotein N-acyltransferase